MRQRRITSLVCILCGGLLGYALATSNTGLVSTAFGEGLLKKTPDEIIYFEVKVPADAVLEIDGVKMTVPGEIRRFQTPPLNETGHYSYELKATVGGKEVTRSVKQRVNLQRINCPQQEDNQPRLAHLRLPKRLMASLSQIRHRNSVASSISAPKIRSPTGRHEWCRPRERRTCCLL